MTKKFCVQIAIDSLFILYVRIATALFVLRVRIALGSIRTSCTNSHDVLYMVWGCVVFSRVV